MIFINRMALDNSFNNFAAIEEQSEKMLAVALEQAAWLPGQGRQAVLDWMAAYRKGSKELKKKTDQAFAKVEQFFTYYMPSKKGFWFKIQADPGFKPQAYSGMLRI